MSTGSSPNDEKKSPVFQGMVFDILESVLQNADNPGALCSNISKVRELTGARTVILLQYLHAFGGSNHRLICVNPDRQQNLAKSSDIGRLAELIYSYEKTKIWDPETYDGDGEKILANLGCGLSISVPLKVGTFRVGVLLLLDLPDVHSISQVVAILDMLSTVVALVLRNSLLHEELESIVKERTSKQESEEKYRLLVDNLNDLIVKFDTQKRLSFVSPNYSRIFGQTEDQLLGKTFMNLIHKDDRQFVNKSFKSLLKKPHSTYHEVRVLTKEGWRWFAWSARTVLDDKGEVEEIISVGRDITERKQTEEDLRESAERFRQFFENEPEYCYMISLEGEILDINKSALNMLGYKKEEIIGKPLQTIYAPESLPKMKQLFTRWKKTGQLKDEEMVIITKKGDRRTVILSAGVLKDTEGKIVQSISVQKDITERKRNEAINASRLHLMQFAVTHSLDELLEETLNEAERLADSLIGFYHFVEDDQEFLTLQNWSTRTKAEFCQAEGKGLHYAISEAGVWVDCVHQRKPVIHNDYASLLHRKGMPQGHAEVIRELVVPVFRGKKIKAILGVGNKPVDYTAQDVEAVSLLADLAWDIAERKMAEEAYRFSVSHFEDLFNKAAIPLCFVNKELTTLNFNTQFEKTFGYSKEEVPTLNEWWQLAYPDPNYRKWVIDTCDAALQRAVEANTDIEPIEYCVTRKNGDIRTMVVFGGFIRDDLLLTFFDITERKNAEQERLANIHFLESMDRVNRAI